MKVVLMFLMLLVEVGSEESVCVCALQANAGACEESEEVFYYEVGSGNCQAFEGCAGNNGFATQQACADTCTGVDANNIVEQCSEYLEEHKCAVQNPAKTNQKCPRCKDCAVFYASRTPDGCVDKNVCVHTVALSPLDHVNNFENLETCQQQCP